MEQVKKPQAEVKGNGDIQHPKEQRNGPSKSDVDAAVRACGEVRVPKPEQDGVEERLGVSSDPPINEFRKGGEALHDSVFESESLHLEPDEEGPPELPSFKRSSDAGIPQRSKSASYARVEDGVRNKMYKFSLYETSTRFYIVGSDVFDSQFRVLKIDRTSPPGHLNIFEDDIVYDQREMSHLLEAIEDGNKGAGGLKSKGTMWGVLGFIRFTEAYYMLIVTKRGHKAMIGGHYVYQVESTELVPLTTGSTSRFQKDRNPEEARFLSIFSNLDLHRNFYFSYGYDITRTLQQNIIREREALNRGDLHSGYNFNDMFVWNHYLLDPARAVMKNTYDWCLPIIHGYIAQQSLSIFGRLLYVTIIARRSRFFAGARFLKRGTNDLGYVANDVETEQIVCEELTTSLHAPGPKLFTNPRCTSYVQHRGSIPLFWTQDNSGVTPKPDIELNLIDPFYSAAALHFDNLFARYGSPVYVLNLIKARERTPRESKLLYEYKGAIDYLNQSLPEEHKILYEAFDMSRASKTRGQDVIGSLELIAERVLEKTGFFHNGDLEDFPGRTQNGVARTNCIDCLDRTNAAQFVIGKRAFGHQLKALGVIPVDTVDYDSDAVNAFTKMFHDHGDTIAIQYGGSHLVNTMATYRKLNQWQTQSRDMVESFKRYYHNSFLDSQRQEAYNLFLGNYIFTLGQPMLWDLTTDYYLHHVNPRSFNSKTRKNYINWYTPSNLEPRKLPPYQPCHPDLPKRGIEFVDNYWLEYYKPLALSSFKKVFAFKLQTTSYQEIDKAARGPGFDESPFKPRKRSGEAEDVGKKPLRKTVTISEPEDDRQQDQRMRSARHSGRTNSLASVAEDPVARQSILRESHFDTSMPSSTTLSNPPSSVRDGDQSGMAQWSLTQFYNNSLNPAVTQAEAEEYQRYVNHPLNLPLVISAELPTDFASLDLVEYVNSVNSDVGNGKNWDVSEEDVAEYLHFLEVSDNPLDVTEDDNNKKRYKRYKQWLRGKSLFKQSKVDPEYKA